MPIVDNELTRHGEAGDVCCPFEPVGTVLSKVLRSNVSQHGDAVWLTDVSTGKSMTYSSLIDRMDVVAANLRRRGLETNDVVLIMAANHVEVALFFYAVWTAGGSNACLTLNLLTEDIRRRGKEVGAKFILTDEQRAARVVEAAQGIDSISQVFVIGAHEKCTPFHELLQEPIRDRPEEADVDPEAMAWLMYSSGTTGVSKGIVHTQRTVSKYMQSPYVHSFLNRRVLFINYMINAGGMMFALSLTAGHAQVFCFSDFSDDKLLPAIQLHKPDLVSLFPSQMAYICRHPQVDQFDLSSVATVLTGGSCINPFYERRFFSVFPKPITLGVIYGMSEVFAISSDPLCDSDHIFPKISEPAAKRIFGSVGKLLPGNKLKVIDTETGRKLGPGQVGEICVQTPSMMKEYLNRPDETARTIVDGWLHTGDEGYFDEDENIFVIGRYKELIKYRMAHVVPTNVEKHLLTHPDVEDAAVVGQPHEVDGELATAFVVIRAGCSITADELIRFVDERVVEEEKLRGGVHFTDRIPRNDLGKIVRHQLVKLLSPGQV